MKRIVWFREDLRLRDNPALYEAAKDGAEVVPVFILDEDRDWAPGGASRVWLHHSLDLFQAEIEKRGGALVLEKGKPEKVLPKLVKSLDAEGIFWNRCYDSTSVAEGNKIKKHFQDEEVECRSFNGNLLAEPWEVKNGSGDPYKVFSPFWRSAKEVYKKLSDPLALPRHLEFAKLKSPPGKKLEALKLLTGRPWEEGMMKNWEVGEENAWKKLRKLGEDFLKGYPDKRDLPAEDGTSQFSPHLHFGEITSKQILHTLGLNKKSEPFIRQLAWREFAHSLLYYFPETPTKPMNAQFKDFKWKKNKKALERWQKGQTGYPIVDAGMRQLWATGWMHNRVRMIVGSFLIKHLLIPWNDGAEWFWDTLVDADLPNNTMGWQWVAGCGADAAPFFRIFNPMLQGKKFDGDGEYVKTWVPELSKVPKKYIHAPWEMPKAELKNLGVFLGQNYPEPMVDHGSAREKALETYHDMRD